MKKEICTSHDIAPLIYKYFNIKKGFEHDTKFKIFLKTFKGIKKLIFNRFKNSKCHHR